MLHDIIHNMKLNYTLTNFTLVINIYFKIDDLDDANILDSLMDQFPPPNILVYSTEEIIGLSPEHIVKCCQSFTQVKLCHFLRPSFTVGIFSFNIILDTKKLKIQDVFSFVCFIDVARKNSSII